MEKAFDKYPQFQLLNKKQLKMLDQNSSIFRYSAKDIIFRQDTRIAHVSFGASGLVKIVKEHNASMSMLIKFIAPGNFIGLSSHFGGDIYDYSAIALEPAEILTIDAASFKILLEENQEFNLNIIKLISQETLEMIRKLMNHTHKHLPGRIADLLLFFSEEFYKSHKFILPVTRKELAEYVGVTTESLIRTMTEFKNDKIIDIDGTNISINSFDILKMLSTNG